MTASKLAGGKRQQAAALQIEGVLCAIGLTAQLTDLAAPGAYIVTGATYLKKPTFAGHQRLEYLCDLLLDLAEKYRWQLQAWAVFTESLPFHRAVARGGWDAYRLHTSPAFPQYDPSQPLGRSRWA